MHHCEFTLNFKQEQIRLIPGVCKGNFRVDHLTGFNCISCSYSFSITNTSIYSVNSPAIGLKVKENPRENHPQRNPLKFPFKDLRIGII